MSNYSGRELVMAGMEEALFGLQIESLMQNASASSAACWHLAWFDPCAAGFRRLQSDLAAGPRFGFILPSQSYDGGFTDE